MFHIFIINSLSADGHLDWFHVLVIVNRQVTSMLLASLKLESFWCTPRSGVASSQFESVLRVAHQRLRGEFLSPEAMCFLLEVSCFISNCWHLVPVALGTWIRKIAGIISSVIFMSKP